MKWANWMTDAAMQVEAWRRGGRKDAMRSGADDQSKQYDVIVVVAVNSIPDCASASSTFG